MDHLVHIEDVAQRNELPLFRTSRPRQYKAHCPICQDRRRQFHLYVSADRDVYYCHKCGATGGVIAFHAWLRGISFESAKADLYPPPRSTRHGDRRTIRKHPAETLTREQLQQLGFTLRTPKRFPPTGVNHAQWALHRQWELDWIWSQWLSYQRQLRRTQTNILRAGLQSGWAYKHLVLTRARRVSLKRRTIVPAWKQAQ